MLALAEVKDHYEIIIVGGGPAGCSFARTLLEQGLPAQSILIVDKESFPRDKICGDGLTHNAVPLIRQVFPELREQIPSSNLVQTMLVHFPYIDTYQRFVQNTDVVPRKELDHKLWKSVCEHGVPAIDRARVRQLLFDDDRVNSGVRLEVGDETREITSQLVVGADGSAGVVRKKTGPIDRDHRITAIRQYMIGIDSGLDELRFFLDYEGKGYFWVFPFHEGETPCANIGYGRFSPGAANVVRRFRKLKESAAVQQCLGAVQEEGPAKAFPINLALPGLFGRTMARRPWGPGFILLGDAAALVAPYSGEGIAFAIWSGKIAGECLDADDLGGRRWKRAYERRIKRIIRFRHDRLMGVLLMGIPWRLGPRLTELMLRSLYWVAKGLLLVKKDLGARRRI